MSTQQTTAWGPLDLTPKTDPRNISVKQTLELPDEYDAMKVLDNRYAILKGDTSPVNVCCVDLTDGRIIWQHKFEGSNFANAMCIDGTLYATIEEGHAKFHTVAIDILSGEIRWKTFIAKSYDTIPNGSGYAFADGLLYYFAGTGLLFAMATTDGSVKFKVKTDNSDPWVTPVLWRDRVIVQTTSRKKSSLVHYDSQTGALLETVALGRGINLGGQGQTDDPLLLGDELWYVADDNKLHCFDLTMGKEKNAWVLPLKITNKTQNDYISASLVFNDGGFDIRADVPVIARDQIDVRFNPSTGVFTANSPMLDDKDFFCEKEGLRYYHDYNMRDQFLFYIQDKATGELVHSFGLPGVTEYDFTPVKVLCGGTMVILHPDYDNSKFILHLAY